MPAMVVRGRCPWEAFEKDLADALQTCEAPHLQPRRSALGFFPLPHTASHLAAAARALSADAAPAVLGTLLEECRLSGRSLPPSKAAIWENVEQPVAEEEAPLEPWLRGRRPSPEGSPSRSDALGWQLPGRPWGPSAPVSLPGFRVGGGSSAEANDNLVDDRASPSAASSGRRRSWSPRRTAASSSTRSAELTRDDTPQMHDVRTSVDSILSSPHSASLQSQQSSTADCIGTEGSPLQARRSASLMSTLALSISPTAAARSMPPRRYRGFSSDLVLDIPTSRLGLRQTNGDIFATPTSACSRAHLERHTVASRFCSPQGLDSQLEAAECAICMDIFSEGEMIRTLPCCHRFHSCCVDPWLVQRWQCPLCKFEVSAC